MTFDPDFGKQGFARRLFRLRFRGHNHMSQRAFADRYALSVGTVKDLEQGRTSPSRAMLLWIAAIEHDRKAAALIARAEREEIDIYCRANRRLGIKGG